MNIKVNTNISNQFDEVSIHINAPELNEDVQKLVQRITTLSSVKEEVVATKNNEIFLLKTKDILYFYSDEKNNYAKTNHDVYRIKERLYELEEELPSNKFIRISNSCIINIEKTISFDASMIGSLTAKMEDNTKQEVSKRKIKEVMKFLNERK